MTTDPVTQVLSCPSVKLASLQQQQRDPGRIVKQLKDRCLVKRCLRLIWVDLIVVDVEVMGRSDRFDCCDEGLDQYLGMFLSFSLIFLIFDSGLPRGMENYTTIHTTLSVYYTKIQIHLVLHTQQS